MSIHGAMFENGNAGKDKTCIPTETAFGMPIKCTYRGVFLINQGSVNN